MATSFEAPGGHHAHTRAHSQTSHPSSMHHVHRQNHNSSKLPAFRFADLKKDSPNLPLPVLLQQQQQQQQQQQAPPSPADSHDGSSPPPPSAPADPPANPAGGNILDRPRATTTSHISSLSSSQQLPPPDAAINTTTPQPSPPRPPPRSRASTFQTSTSSSPVKAAADAHKRTASFPDSSASPAAASRALQGSLANDQLYSSGANHSAYNLTTLSSSSGGASSAALTKQIATQQQPPLLTTRRTSSYSGTPSAIETTTSSTATPSRPPPTLNTQRLQAVEAAAQAAAAQTPSSAERSTKEWAQGQRELLLPKSLQSSPTDEGSSGLGFVPSNPKRSSVSQRPPVSFKPPINATPAASGSGTPVRVPPIRAFRSSGSRRSLILDMNSRQQLRAYDLGGPDDIAADSNQRDRTLRALEGRPASDDDMLQQLTPPDSAERLASHAASLEDDDTTGDMFLKIAREESFGRRSNVTDESLLGDEQQSTVTRVARTASGRRPFSAAMPLSYQQPTSPPRITRRLSDQQETQRLRSRQLGDEAQADSVRALSYRIAREKAASAHPGEDLGRGRMGTTSARPSPATPRSLAFQQDAVMDAPTSHRRSSITEGSGQYPPRASSYRQSNLSYGRTYNPSPLASRTADVQQSEASHVVEGTESTTSNTAPSTVWDELDELKSRIHRLELTGKLPSTSGAAMSRLSDERPPTATTTATTMSTSPKRGSGSNAAPQADASSTTSSQKEGHPILLSAVTKSKPFLSEEVYKALEAAATDALALSTMMGTAGQPGPISSGASTIGGVGVTDRQLRRKADSVCRSLTELALALSEEAAQQPKTVQAAGTPVKETPTTPTVAKSFAALASQRRPGAVPEPPLARANATTSPRTMTRLEERRTSLLNGTAALPSPRFVSGTVPAIAAEPVGRKSSLLVARARRAGTEEPEEGRKSSLLLRTRRAGTEEPDDGGRKTSLLVSGRRNTISDEDDDVSRFRAPSRAVTEVNAVRVLGQTPAAATTTTLGQSALPRRRPVPSALNSRLVAPSTPTNTAASTARRYLESRPSAALDREVNAAIDERIQVPPPQRQMSLGQSALLNRAGSLSRRQQLQQINNRDSTITNVSTTASAGGYR